MVLSSCGHSARPTWANRPPGTNARTPPARLPLARRPAMAEGYVVRPGQGVPGRDRDLKASRASTGGSLTLLESRLRHVPALHIHAYEDESFYILDGSLTVTCGREVFQAGPRSFVFLPRQVPHTFHPDGDEATVLLMGTPGGLDEYFRDLRLAAGRPGRRCRREPAQHWPAGRRRDRLAALGTIAWTAVANNLRNASAAITAGRQPAASPAQLTAHALATGFSRGFLVAAEIGLLALAIAIASIRVRCQDLTGTRPAPDQDTGPQPAAARQQEDQAALAAAVR